MFSPDVDTRHDGMMSQSVLLECQQGSQIWLEADNDDDCYVWGSPAEYRFSSFGGFMLSANKAPENDDSRYG